MQPQSESPLNLRAWMWSLLLIIPVSTAVSLGRAANANPLLHIGHHAEQKAAQQRRQLLRRNNSNSNNTTETPRHLQLDGADCDTGRLPEDLLRLENDLPTGQCIVSWQSGGNSGGTWFFYPQDFDGIVNQVEEYLCTFPPALDRVRQRIFYSNGFPDHSVRWDNPNRPCEKFWYVEMPSDPIYVEDETWEPPPGGIVAMALNGMPIYGAQEAQVVVGNALEPDVTSDSAVFDARFWYGHSTAAGVAHYHNPAVGRDIIPSEDILLGYALDGFPLYGPVPDEVTLDRCNGRMLVDGDPTTYRYHVRTLEQVDEAVEYCPDSLDNENMPFIRWNYIVGCYHGDPTATIIDSELEAQSFPTPATFPFANNRCTMIDRDRNNGPQPPSEPLNKPNVIIIQPDDLPFYDEWTSPPNNPSEPEIEVPFPQQHNFPHIERLRLNGVQLHQAYAASPACGTSRFSTLTGKLPSRALSNREDGNRQVSTVTIPNTKLEGEDCSSDNLAMQMRGAGYRTGVVGKWHLFTTDADSYTYNGVQDDIKDCGFDFADGIYPENLSNELLQGQFHNMEWVVSNAIDFINEKDDDDKPFMLYFNPTVPHSGGDVYEALMSSCRQTPGGEFEKDFIIKGMTLEYVGCEAYREFVLSRAQAMNDDVTDPGFLRELGAIWLDDAIGALIHALVDKGIFEDTLIIFQQDHGLEAKNTLFENGNRIAQFVHYPNFYGTEGSFSNALVSTIDVAPTIMEFAGAQLPYDHDGQSWRIAISDLAGTSRQQNRNFFEKERCLFFEYQRDRAARCGCAKIMRLTGARNFFEDGDEDSGEIELPTSAPTSLDDVSGRSSTFTLGVDFGFFDQTVREDNPTFLYDLCDGNRRFRGEYITGNDLSTTLVVGNPEAVDLLGEGITTSQGPKLRDALLCFLDSTNALADPIFDLQCSRSYNPVCDSTDDCQFDSIGRTICSDQGLCVSDQTPAPSSSPSSSPSTSPSTSPSHSSIPSTQPSLAPSRSAFPSMSPSDEDEPPPLLAGLSSLGFVLSAVLVAQIFVFTAFIVADE